MAKAEIVLGELSGGSNYQKVTLSAGESKTVNLPFEVKTIVFADTVTTAQGFSGTWTKNLNVSDHTFFWAATNQMTGLGATTIGATNARIQSISADGRTIELYSGSTSGGTTFWLYGDSE